MHVEKAKKVAGVRTATEELKKDVKCIKCKSKTLANVGSLLVYVAVAGYLVANMFVNGKSSRAVCYLVVVTISLLCWFFLTIFELDVVAYMRSVGIKFTGDDMLVLQRARNWIFSCILFCCQAIPFGKMKGNAPMICYICALLITLVLLVITGIKIRESSKKAHTPSGTGSRTGSRATIGTTHVELCAPNSNNIDVAGSGSFGITKKLNLVIDELDKEWQH